MTRRDAEVRLRRLLAVLPWIVQNQGATVAEIAARFQIPPAELEEDLLMLPMCGLPPYTADRLIDLQIDDEGGVTVRFAEYFERPLVLTREEGTAVAVAGRALLAVPGADPSGPLASALEKLEKVLGAAGLVALDVGEPAFLGEVRTAVAARERIEIDYHSYNRDVVTTRQVDPHALFTAGGFWYADAWCHAVDDSRLFRVDRIRDVRPTGEHFEPRDDDRPAPVYDPEKSDPRVTVVLPARARWVAESYPVERVVELADGRLRVVLAVSAWPFLERVLLRVGPEALVESPADATTCGGDAARRVLARYAGT
jgi:proteasome accessory factor C